MGGGLLQLVAMGAQDAYLSGNPQITFWKGLFKRHTNFAMEAFRLNFTGQPNWGTKQSVIVNRNADLLYSTYLEVVLPSYDPVATPNAVYNNDQFRLGYNLLQYVELEIGGQLIDRQYGEWMFLWDTLTTSTDQNVMSQQMLSGAGRNSALQYGASTTVPTGAFTGANGLVTLTVGSTVGIVPGNSVTISTVVPNTLRGTYQVLSVGASTITFANTTLTAAGPVSVAGTVVVTPSGNVGTTAPSTQLGKTGAPSTADVGASSVAYATSKQTASPGQVVAFGKTASCTPSAGNHQGHPNVIYVPLRFFYTRNPGAALPLIALQYHEVKINLLWNSNALVSGDYNNVPVPAQPTQASIYVDYIYLDVEERRRMAQESHEYLIEQVQYNEDKGLSSYNTRLDLTFNHPVKELVWVVQPTCYRNCKIAIPGVGANTTPVPNGVRYTDHATNSGSLNVNRLTPFTYDQNAVYKQHLQINGQDRFDARYGDYFNKVQVAQHHTGSASTGFANYSVVSSTPATSLLPASTVFGTGPVSQSPQPGIYVYSFALKPEEHQPSGTCNFSRIDTATLAIALSGDIVVNPSTDETWDVRVYATNYNILRIMSGMAGLAYSN